MHNQINAVRAVFECALFKIVIEAVGGRSVWIASIALALFAGLALWLSF